MTFLIFKFAWAVLRPGNLIALALALGGALALFAGGRWRRLGRVLLTAGIAALLALMVLPVGTWLTSPLESRVPQAELPETVDGIMVLGGPVLPAHSARFDTLAVNAAGERLWAGLALARRFPQAKVVYSGGSGDPFAQGPKEATVVRALFAELGFAGPRFVFEDQSRNTRENATLSRALADPQAGEAWVLVTSAAHMPRALATFQAVGWEMLPFPVDYRTRGSGSFVVDLAVTEELSLLEYGLREWLGLAAYRLRGWTTSLWPQPPHQSSG